MKRFHLQNYNEFKSKMRWHDYFAFVLHEFPVLLIRRYDWMDEERSTLKIQLLGWKVYQRIWKWE
jgi:hypothetical protein